jgi:UDP-N-acetylglucosamine 2-epimerase (non-hydrolysing)
MKQKAKNNKGKKHLAVILGTRPNFIKAAPFFKRALEYPEFKFSIIHTGQHYDENMSEIFLREMGVPKPNIFLSNNAKLPTEKIGRMFNDLKKIFGKNKYDGAIVFGDVNSTLAGALAAKFHNCKLIHIESGLRSHDRRMPEETNRVIVDHLSDLLLTTEPAAKENLIKEGIERKNIKYVGNIMIENIEIFSEEINHSKILKELKLPPKSYIVATIHRQENIGYPETFKKLLEIINIVNKKIKIVFPLHPGTKNKLTEWGFMKFIDKLLIIEPKGYFDFMKLVMESQGVITDSGGIQEETSYLGIPCATLRDNTERPITVLVGSNKLFPANSQSPDEIIKHLLKTNFKSKHIPLWDEKVSKRILKALSDFTHKSEN